MKIIKQYRTSGVITNHYVVELKDGRTVEFDKWWAEDEVDWEYDSDSKKIVDALSDEESDELYDLVSELTN